MEDEELIKKLHIGQVLILTYAEAIAVSLEKVSSGTPLKIKYYIKPKKTYILM